LPTAKYIGFTNVNSGFYQSGKLKYVELPDTLTEIGSNAFYGCGAL
jgi:hypothetical protein